MTPKDTRRIRLGLVAFVIVVVAWVAVSLRTSKGQSAPPATSTSASGASVTRMTDYIWETKTRDGRDVVLRAKQNIEQEGAPAQLEACSLQFPYLMRGKAGMADLVSDRCDLARVATGKGGLGGRAVFTGAVRVSSPDGFHLEGVSLVYDSRTEIAESEQEVSFGRKAVSGRGRGLRYDPAGGTLELLSDAHVTIEDEKGPIAIRSERAVVSRAEQTIRFVGDVDLTQVRDELRAGELVVNFNDAADAIQRAEAIGDVSVRTYGAVGPFAPKDGAPSGLRELRGRRVDLWFRPDRTIEMMEAGPEGVLVLHPGPGDLREVRRLSASQQLTFLFDEAGRLTEIQGRRDSRFVTEPMPGSDRAPRSMSCQNLVARFRPETGELDNGDFSKDVVFAVGQRKASAQQARYERGKAGGTLMLKDHPEVVDLTNGSRLSASAIDIGAESGDMAARHQVRHFIPSRKGGGVFGGEGETLITCRLFAYDRRHDSARYRQQAVLRSGSDELRAQEIIVEDTGDRVTAEGDVASLFVPRGKEGEAAAPIDARSRHMVFDRRKGQADYTGDVVMRHGEITMHSVRSVVFLTQGAEVDRLEAGDSVRVEGGGRRASGAKGVYDPRARTVTLTGRVSVSGSDGQTVRGRSLTFNLADDTIHIDGQEEARTEAVLRKEPRP